MKAVFASTPAFRNFKDVMRRLIQVPKAEVDALVAQAKENSPRNSNPNAPGRKARKTRKRRGIAK